MKKTILTGVKSTGIPHVGNYFGSFKPSIEGAKAANMRSFLFIADYHALTTVKCAAEMKENVNEIACTWLACGLDLKKTAFYRQSDVPQIFELAIILSNVTPKGLMNRSHAYKAVVQDAVDAGKDPDVDVNMGLFCYPILMSADILAFDTNFVPVGQDQKQHVEIAQAIARSFNAIYGSVLVVPEPKITKDQATIPGLDGRKMSKSYGNQIPMFAPEGELKKYIMKIVTDSSLPTDPKSTDCVIFDLYKLFATDDEVHVMKSKFENGIGWGEVKNELFRVANRTLTPLREKYNYFKSNPEIVEQLLQDGAKKARKVAQKTLDRIRKSIMG
ncbi:MAG: tryptophan--tRNA ligase [Firmicutes bacterium]|nr:tryptophan--tRNA ligase [Bacillota bacterium]